MILVKLTQPGRISTSPITRLKSNSLILTLLLFFGFGWILYTERGKQHIALVLPYVLSKGCLGEEQNGKQSWVYIRIDRTV